MKYHIHHRSISLPIILGSIAVALTIALLVGWTLVSLQNIAITRRAVQNTWLLIAGLVSFSIILSVVILFSVFLIHEILEVRRQTTFIDSVTHELKSPLASIKLGLETLARPNLTEPQVKNLRHMMLSDVDRLTTFIDDILEASRLSHGRRSFTLSEVYLNDLAQRCVESLSARYKLKPNSVKINIADNLLINSDATAIETIIKNLLDNGIKYSNDPIEVIISAKNNKNVTIIEVKDHGIGIAPKNQKRLFERFYRVPNEMVYKRNGTGLGLFVVASLVRNLQGSLRVHSDGIKQGTSFCVELPLASKTTRGSI
ncbi:MAG: HAMP domain-containing histidine kinase [Deltaproteobacteria bacterium]|nr:HAMP domain-containing histidine kinase [Deltaproteobacteria bacterium]